jgi:Prokaryotic cytochrome b561
LVVAFTVTYLTEDDLLKSPCLGRLRRRRAERGADHLGLRRAGLGLDLRTDRNAAYVRDLVLFRAERHLGHSPGGGTMGVLLLVFLAATVVIGLMVYGGDHQAGPLAGMVTKANGEAMEKVHEVIANITLALVLAHVAAVVLASLHHENLVRP